MSGLSRSGGRRLARNRKVRIEPGKWHTVIVQRTGPWFSMVVDGDPVFLVKDPHPIENPRARRGLLRLPERGRDRRMRDQPARG